MYHPKQSNTSNAVEPFFHALLDHFVDCKVVDYDASSKRLLHVLTVETTEYIIEFYPRDPSRLTFGPFRISKSFHSLRKLAKHLNKEAGLAVGRSMNQQSALYIQCSRSEVEKSEALSWDGLSVEIKRVVKLVEDLAEIVNSEPKKYLAKVISTKSLSKRRVSIISSAIKTLLYNFPSKNDIDMNVRIFIPAYHICPLFAQLSHFFISFIFVL